MNDREKQALADAFELLTAENNHTARALIEAGMGATPSVVFVAFTVPDHEGSRLQGVFSTRERAEAAIAALDTSAHRFAPVVVPVTLDAMPHVEAFDGGTYEAYGV